MGLPVKTYLIERRSRHDDAVRPEAVDSHETGVSLREMRMFDALLRQNEAALVGVDLTATPEDVFARCERPLKHAVHATSRHRNAASSEVKQRRTGNLETHRKTSDSSFWYVSITSSDMTLSSQCLRKSMST